MRALSVGPIKAWCKNAAEEEKHFFTKKDKSDIDTPT